MLYRGNTGRMMMGMMCGMCQMPCCMHVKKKCFSAVWHDPDGVMRV